MGRTDIFISSSLSKNLLYPSIYLYLPYFLALYFIISFAEIFIFFMLLIIPLQFFDCLKCVIVNLYSVSKTSILDTFIWVFCVIVLPYYSKNFGIEDSRHPHHGLSFKLHFPYLTISVIFAVGICKNPLSH